MLPLREIVLYKSGVGFFTREGDVEGESVTLTFRHDEINDILKSLAVFDKTGGQVIGIHYQTPMDRAARLSGSSIQLSEYGSLYDLLRELRGRRVTLTFEDVPTLTGRIIGLDRPMKEGTASYVTLDPMSTSAVMILTDSNEVSIHRLHVLRSLKIEDEQAERDLAQVLETSLIEESRRTVTVNLNPGSHQLIATYVAPSSSWRVSYRLVAESSEDGKTGKAYLQGWGLFDNRMGEDLENVKVMLVVGQPISFVYDLYGSYVPQRTQVADQEKIAPGPVEYDLDDFGPFGDSVPMPVMQSAGRAKSDIAALKGLEKIRKRPGMYVGGVAPRMSSAQAAQSAPTGAQTADSGEFFQYEIINPVSVKRGESALVPIVGAEISYERELLYNRAKLANNPVVALRFTNTTGLILERGPVTVVEDDVYKGEAIVPLTRLDNPIYLPYAVESGVKIVEHDEWFTEIIGLRIVGMALIQESFSKRKVSYELQNITAKALTVIIEAPITTGYDLYETRPPDVQTLTDRRWRIDIPANSKTEFVRKERLSIIRHIIGFPSITTITRK